MFVPFGSQFQRFKDFFIGAVRAAFLPLVIAINVARNRSRARQEETLEQPKQGRTAEIMLERGYFDDRERTIVRFGILTPVSSGMRPASRPFASPTRAGM